MAAAADDDDDDDSVSTRMLRALRLPSSTMEDHRTDDDTHPENFALADSDLMRSHLVDQFRDHMNLDATPDFFSPDPPLIREENDIFMDPGDDENSCPLFALYKI